jgi:polysaccharide deacetylase family protein (PEP-CTERM system associated)
MRQSVPNGHHFTVDVEEYFQVAAFERYLPRESWDYMEWRVARGVARLLELLDRHRATATFFVLGWVAERQPDVVQAIASAGHEVASHGWDHRRLARQTPGEFRDSVRRTKDVLQQLTGRVVLGFRAPSFSIIPGREWALDILIEEGYGYDSSLFPVRRPGYGYPRGKRDPYCLVRPAGRLVEVPPTTLRRLGVNLPAAGGAYLRLLPYELTRAAVRDCERRGQPATIYVHPWELDPGHPRLAVGWVTRLRHYGRLNHVYPRLERLLSEFRFSSIAGRSTVDAMQERATLQLAPAP